MFLVVIPLVSLIKVFNEYGLHRRPHGKRIHARAPDPELGEVPLEGINVALPVFNPFIPMSFGPPNGVQPSARISATSIHTTAAP